MKNTKAVSALTKGAKWWITDGFLPHGRKLAGPFTTQEDAFAARLFAERLGSRTYFIDATTEQPT